MKIKNKFNLILGLLLLAGDLYVLYHAIFADITQDMAGYIVFSHMGAMVYAYLRESPYVGTCALVPGVIMLIDNMSKEWEEKYSWILFAPLVLLGVIAFLAGFFV